MRKVMVRAWEIARAAASKFGGKAFEYIAGALRAAWSEFRNRKTVAIELRQANRRQKTWVAAIVGTHPVYKLARKFVNPDQYGSTTWTLKSGIYEICENGNRYFIVVKNGKIDYIETKDVMIAVA